MCVEFHEATILRFVLGTQQMCVGRILSQNPRLRQVVGHVPSTNCYVIVTSGLNDRERGGGLGVPTRIANTSITKGTFCIVMAQCVRVCAPGLCVCVCVCVCLCVSVCVCVVG